METDGHWQVKPARRYDSYTVAARVPDRYHVTVHDAIPSTNDRVEEQLENNDHDDILTAARIQTAGRGRGDNQWTSPRGGIWASIGERLDRNAASAIHAQQAMAVAVAEVIRSLGVPTRLKWPNDVVTIDGNKLAGILASGRTVDDRLRQLVIGFGINANVDPAQLPDRASSVLAQRGPIARVDALGAVIHRFESRRTRPEAVQRAWNEYGWTVNRRVRVETDTDTYQGQAVAIDRSGVLVLDDASSRHTIRPERCRRCRVIE